jgi:hypothetical protein
MIRRALVIFCVASCSTSMVLAQSAPTSYVYDTTTNSTAVSTNNNTNTSTSTNTNVNQNINSGTVTNVNQNTSTSAATNTNVNQNTDVSTSTVNSTSAATTNNTNQNNNVNVSDSKSYSESVNRQVIDQNLKSPPPSAIAPSMMSYSQDLCTTGMSGAVQTQILGISAGKAIRDSNCERIKLSKTLFDMGMRVAAVSLLCQDDRVFRAMEMAGTPCPFMGLIGNSAKEAWAENPEQRPDAKSKH